MASGWDGKNFRMSVFPNKDVTFNKMRRISDTATNDSIVSKVQSPLPPCAQRIQSGIKAGFRVCAIGTLCQCKLALHDVAAVLDQEKKGNGGELMKHEPLVNALACDQHSERP